MLRSILGGEVGDGGDDNDVEVADSDVAAVAAAAADVSDAVAAAAVAAVGERGGDWGVADPERDCDRGVRDDVSRVAVVVDVDVADVADVDDEGDCGTVSDACFLPVCTAYTSRTQPTISSARRAPHTSTPSCVRKRWLLPERCTRSMCCSLCGKRRRMQSSILQKSVTRPWLPCTSTNMVTLMV